VVNGLRAALAEEDLGILVGERMDMSQQCTLAAQKDNYLGLHQKKCDQQVEGRGSAPLLRSHETPPGALHPALGFPVQERHEPVRVGPEEGHKNGLRTGTPLL